MFSKFREAFRDSDQDGWGIIFFVLIVSFLLFFLNNTIKLQIQQ